MEDEKKNDQPAPDCCSEVPSPDARAPGDAPPSCGCGVPPPNRSKLKDIITAVILLAAAGAGAYSLAVYRGGREKCCSQPASASRPQVNPQGMKSREPARPPCCGGEAPLSPSAPGSCGSGADQDPLPGDQPSCGEKAMGCCGL